MVSTQPNPIDPGFIPTIFHLKSRNHIHLRFNYVHGVLSAQHMSVTSRVLLSASLTFSKSSITRFCNSSESMTLESTLLSTQQTKKSSSAKSFAMLTYLSLGHWFLKCPTSLQFQHVTLEQSRVFDWLLLFLLPLSLIFLLPLMTYNNSLDNSP